MGHDYSMPFLHNCQEEGKCPLDHPVRLTFSPCSTPRSMPLVMNTRLYEAAPRTDKASQILTTLLVKDCGGIIPNTSR